MVEPMESGVTEGGKNTAICKVISEEEQQLVEEKDADNIN